MIKKLPKYFHTLRYLKFKQIYFRFFYLLKKRWRNFVKSKVDISIKTSPTKLNLTEFIAPNNCLEKNSFVFLNLSKAFSKEVDWEFADFGKLWTYNLNYFDFLNQPDVELDKKIGFIKSFIANINNNKIALEPYPTSLRCVNWVKFLSINRVDDAEINSALYAQYKILSKNLEYHLLGNHLLENAFALLFGAYYFRDQTFYNKAKKILLAELDEQILSDGAHFELSPMYHQIILQKMLDSVNLTKNNQWSGSKLNDLLTRKSSDMLGWLRLMSFRNGDIPLVNDCAYGIAPSTTQLFGYAKRLSIQESNKALKDSGYRKIVRKNYELVLDIGRIGPDYIPGHAHCDTFSFILYIDGKPFIVDTGTSTYEVNKDRFEEKSTSAHNTIQIDDYEQSEIWDSFRVGRRAYVNDIKETTDMISATHDGYKPIGAMHKRSFKFCDDMILIQDNIESKKDHYCCSYLHFHPSINVSLEGSAILANGKSINFENAEVFLKEYHYAQEFNKTTQAKSAVINFKQTLTTKIKIN